MHPIVSAYSWGRRFRAAQPGEVDLATSKQYAVSHSLLHDCADSNTLFPKTFVAFEILNVPNPQLLLLVALTRAILCAHLPVPIRRL